MTAKIVLGVDGSEHAARAIRWCADHAAAFGAEVVVVHAVDTDAVFGAGAPIPLVPPVLNAGQLEELRDVVTRDWCKVLADAGIRYRVVVAEGRPSEVVMETALAEHADLVVCGRRGRGGAAEFLLGSTSRELSHHVKVPLVVVP